MDNPIRKSEATPGTADAPPVTPEALQEIAGWYESGHYIRAYNIARRFGPLEHWQQVDQAIWAGRLAGNLGAHRLALIIFWRNRRRNPTHLDACCYYANGLLERRGPLAAGNYLRELSRPGTSTPPEVLIYLLTLRADVAEAFRDFVSAEKWLREADTIDSTSPWLQVAWSRLLERQDRYPEALERSRQALVRNRFYRPAAQQFAHLLQVLDRDEEALSFLAAAAAGMESGSLTAQFAVLLQETEQYDAALKQFDRYVELSPLADVALLEWVNRRRVAIACRVGNRERALALSRTIDDPWYREFVIRLEDVATHFRQRTLNVPFVRQHHVTCAPATLTALSRYWNRPADHLEVAERICYDGTPAHSERHWAESQHWLAREFTVTWNAAVDLIGAGIPFTLTTTTQRGD